MSLCCGDDCILGEDFLFETGVVKELFEDLFGIIKKDEKEDGQICSRIEKNSIQLPDFLLQIKEQSSLHLDAVQTEIFPEFLFKFRDVFSEKVVAGSCNLLCHKIKLKDTRPIKDSTSYSSSFTKISR